MALELPIIDSSALRAGQRVLGRRITVEGDGTDACINAFIERFHTVLFNQVHEPDCSALYVTFDGTPAVYDPTEATSVHLQKQTMTNRNVFSPNSIWHIDPKQTNMVGFPRLDPEDRRIVIPTCIADSEESVDTAFRQTYGEISSGCRLMDPLHGDPQWYYARSNLALAYKLVEQSFGLITIPEHILVDLHTFFERMYQLLHPDHCCTLSSREGALLAYDTENLPHARMPFHNPDVEVAPFISAIMWRKKIPEKI